MAPVSLLTDFALAICPIVAFVFVALYGLRRDPLYQPSIVAAIPLGLSSIAILLGQSGVVLLATFQQIATQRTAGMKAVVAGLLQAQRPLTWGLLDFGICLIFILLVSVFLRHSRDAETPVIHAYVSMPALIVTAVVVIGLFLMVWLQYSTVDLVMMIVDKHRDQELASAFGNVNPASFAARISSRLVLITFGSIAEFCALLVAGGLSLGWRQKQDPRVRFAAVLTVGALIACGASALSEFGFVDYLQHLR
jgi:hypothetical protein